jgi:hypothetical protein
MHPFLLLVCFNVFSKSVNPWLMTAATWWGKFLTLSGPLFIIMEGVSSLLVAQKLGQMGKRIVGEGEVYQFVMLIATAVAYVISAWWIVVVSNWPHFLSPFLSICKAYPTAASSPLSSTLLGVALSICHSSLLLTLLITFVSRFCIPDIYRVRLATNKHYRVIGFGSLHRLQRVALRL